MNIKYISLVLVAFTPVIWAQSDPSDIDVEISEDIVPEIEFTEGLTDEVYEASDDSPVLIKIREPMETADEGIRLQVDEASDDSEVVTYEEDAKITAPWPAKPDENIPDGWELSPAPENLVDYKTSIVLENGKSISVTMTPFVLVPKNEDSSVVRIQEPGFDATMLNEQDATMGALLGSATQQLEEKEKQTATVINNLQQLLSSLPK